MIRKLILPVAGIGKRLRPLTLTTPKNLIPLRGRPILEYTLEEAEQVGFTDIILVISPEHKEKYEQYLEMARAKFPRLTFHVRFQEKPWGNGHAVLQASDLIKPGEAFAVRFPDDVILADEPTLGQLVAFYEEYQAPVLFLGETEDVTRYGIVKATAMPEPDLFRIWDLIEKPKREDAPSNLFIIGGYVLTYRVLEDLTEIARNMAEADDALPLTEAFLMELRAGRPIYGWQFLGTRLDCGTLDGLKQAEEHIAGLIRTAA